jgi:hypothetical protein
MGGVPRQTRGAADGGLGRAPPVERGEAGRWQRVGARGVTERETGRGESGEAGHVWEACCRNARSAECEAEWPPFYPKFCSLESYS